MSYIPLVSIERKLLMRYNILMQQMGNVARDIVFLLRGVDGYMDEFDQVTLKIDLADASIQLNLLCQELKLNPDEVLKLGKERYEERREEFRMAGKEKLFI